jgi:uroporphyrinogen-III synthase
VELAGKTILVTRPAGRADDLTIAIEAAGGSVRHIPLLELVPLDRVADAEQWLHTRECVAHLGRYERVIAVSVNAVDYGLDWIMRNWQERVPPQIRWYGIGAATVAALAGWNIDAQGAADMTSEALLALPELQQVKGEQFLILRGVGGRETLAQTLRARGAEVDYAECYRRRRPQLDTVQQTALWQPPADAVCVNSGETLANLWEYLPEPARRLYHRVPLLVPGERVAQQARALGFERVVVAANAGTAATLAALSGIAKDSTSE